MRTRMRCQVVDCGEYCRVNCYPVSDYPRRRRGERLKPTNATQAKLNDWNSRQKLTDMLHLNMTPMDAAVHLTYEDGMIPESVEEARRLSYNYMERLRRAWAKETGHPASEFKWIIVDEQSTTGRWHHHCVISGGLSMEVISDKWGYGHTTTKALEFGENGLVGLATYITKSKVGYRRWRSSKNLTHPAVRESDHKVSQRDVKYITENPDDVGFMEQVYSGYSVSPESVKILADGAVGAGCFVSWRMYKTDNGYFYRDKFGILRQKRKKNNKRE